VETSTVIAVRNVKNVESQFQKNGRRLAMPNHCPLCNLNLENEVVYGEYGPFLVIRTKTMKGHRERIMIVIKQHVHHIRHVEFEAALEFLVEIGKKVFSYTPKFVIMDSTFATINEHWHLVATDLDPKSEDFEQILRTKWIKVVDNTWLD